MNYAFDDALHLPYVSSCDVGLSVLVKSGHLNLLRLSSLHLCNEYLSLQTKQSSLVLHRMLGPYASLSVTRDCWHAGR